MFDGSSFEHLNKASSTGKFLNVSAEVHSGENDQCKRQWNIIVYGVANCRGGVILGVASLLMQWQTLGMISL